MAKKLKRPITQNEWILIAMLLVGILLVILRWNAICEVLQQTFRAYFP